MHSDVGDVLGRDAAPGERNGAIDEGLGHGPAGIGLEGDGLHDPARAEAIEERGEVRLARWRKRLEEAMPAFEHRARTDKAAPCHQRSADAGLRRPAGMHALRPAPIAEIFDDARSHAAGDAERRRDLLTGHAEGAADAAGGRERAEHGGRMKAGRMDRLRRDQCEAAEQLDAGGDAEQQAVTTQPFALGDRQDRRDDHGPGMDRAALEGVVVILAMRGGAVQERGAEGIEIAAMTEHGAGAAAIDRLERRGDIGLVARGDAKPGHVEHELARGLDRGRRDVPGFQSGQPFGNRLADGGHGR